MESLWKASAAMCLSASLAGPAAAGPPQPVCEARTTGHGAGEMRCRVDASATRRLRFEMALAGVHDDSQAGLAMRLAGRPLACLPGSRPRIAGEGEGSVLSCDFDLPAADEPQELLIQLVWHHAEPNGFRFSDR